MKILVINVGGLQAGYVGCYGNPWIATPHLDRLATEGVVFDQHYADEPSPAGACRSWRSGCFHWQGVGSANDRSNLDLIDLLHDRHVAALLFDPAGLMANGPWDHVSDESDIMDAFDPLLNRCEKQKDWFLWLDLDDLAPPWQIETDILGSYFEPEADNHEAPLDEEAEEEVERVLEPLLAPAVGMIDVNDDEMFLRLQSTYAAAVSQVDATIGQLLEVLEERGLFEDMAIVVTADHGFPLGEHGMVGLAHPWLHEELIHVPLIIRRSGGVDAGRRVSALTQSVDLMPTLLELFQLPIPDTTQGVSLLAGQSREYVCCGLQLGGACEWALRTREWGLILPEEDGRHQRSTQLFLKPEDRWEVNNVIHHHPEQAEDLESTLRSFVQAAHQPGKLVSPPLFQRSETAE